jgi:hypothetical protein
MGRSSAKKRDYALIRVIPDEVTGWLFTLITGETLENDNK